MKIVRRLLLASIVAFGATALSGCGVGTTYDENIRTLKRVADYDARMMGDDVRLLTQTRRPWRGSRYVMP